MRVVLILALLLVTAGAASWAAKVDIVAPTRGEVVARQRTREVQAPESGVVAALHAEEGAPVRRGMLLVELDDTIVGSEIRRIEAGLREARRRAHRLRLLVARPGDGAGPGDGSAAEAEVAAENGNGDRDANAAVRESRHVAAPEGADGQERARHVRLADLERRRLAAALAEASRKIEMGRLGLSAVAAERRLVDRLLPVVRERVDGLAALAVHSHASRHDYLRQLSRRIEMEGRAESLAIDARREEEEIARLRASRRLLRLEFETARQRELVEVELRLVELREDLVQARRRRLRHRIAAPLDGVVQDLGELAEGSFVVRGDRLMAVVPAGGGLEIRAYLRNRDVGFVEPGQEAIVKVDAFPFTRYGTTEGVVEGVSLDAIGVGGLASPGGEPGEFTTGYRVRIALTRPSLEIDGAVVPLRPGMHAAVDIRTGRRRLLEYVISPLVAYGSNAFRER